MTTPTPVTLHYPPELPIVGRRVEIMAAIAAHPVVIVAGETGSGKSTQLPKMCLELGRGADAMIGHTQPRRIAARAVAERLAEELGTTVGGAVGYTVRFTDRVGEDTRIRVMTDGILLAEIQRDRLLRRYDTLVVDEAHERSLNIDFILGYLKQLLPRRPDLKVVVTSATIDTARFAEHFDDAPVVEVSGRAHPVEVRYRPIDQDAGADQSQAIAEAVAELAAGGPGDVLVFLSGEREIRDAAEVLAGAPMVDAEVLPLYARLSAAEQHRVFAPHEGRRVVLATNVAETSLTVPGVRFVVDTGTARVSRYNRRTKVQRLPIEAVSQAAANQRAGRCGRVAPGVCIRLYNEEDFAARAEFTDAEILRTNLASVILQMTAAGLGDVAAFPFVDAPDARNIADGVALLEELGALAPERRGDAEVRLTDLGRRLARLPVDPRLGRMVLEAERHGCVREVMVIAAALSIQDPRERPAAKQLEADESHARFADPSSDFVALLRLWDHLREQQRGRSSSQFRRLCRSEYLHHLRVREWQDIYGQLRHMAGRLGLRVNTEPARPAAVHQAVLAGLLSHVGLRRDDQRDYLGARGAHFALSPGSGLAGRRPRWVMAAELVETSRLWARVAAQVQPEWIERAGAHVVQRSRSEPWWDAGRATAVAVERVSLYGIPLVTDRRVDYGRIDRRAARALFIRHALMDGEWAAAHPFLAANRELLDDAHELGRRARRWDLVVDDDAIADFYDARLGDGVVSGQRFEAWWAGAGRSDPERLHLRLDDVVDPKAGTVSPADFPDSWHQGDVELALRYVFDPGGAEDGVTVHVPLEVLGQVSAQGFDWHVPGRRPELVAALLRLLPKATRRAVLPVADHAAAFLEDADPTDGPLREALARWLARTTGAVVTAASFPVDQLPAHLVLRFLVEEASGRPVAVGTNLDALRQLLPGQIRAALVAAVPGVERAGIVVWDFGALAPVVTVRRPTHTVRAYPALVDEGGSVAVRVHATDADQRRAMAAGTRRLLLLGVAQAGGALIRRLSRATTQSVGELVDECLAAAVDVLVTCAGGPAWDAAGYERLADAVRTDVVERAWGILRQAARIVSTRRALDHRLDGLEAPGLEPAVADVRAQLERLAGAGFVGAAGADRLDDIERYLRAAGHRLDRLPAEPARDRDRMDQVHRVEREYAELVADLPPDRRCREATVQIRWMIEELRVSLFAQNLGTPYPVSEQRIGRAMDAVAAG